MDQQEGEGEGEEGRMEDQDGGFHPHLHQETEHSGIIALMYEEFLKCVGVMHNSHTFSTQNDRN